MPRLEHNGCARQSALRCFLHVIEQLSRLGGWNGPRTSLCIVYASNVVHAACDEEDAVGRPGQVVYFRAY